MKPFPQPALETTALIGMAMFAPRPVEADDSAAILPPAAGADLQWEQPDQRLRLGRNERRSCAWGSKASYSPQITQYLGFDSSSGQFKRLF